LERIRETLLAPRCEASRGITRCSSDLHDLQQCAASIVG
jgi:hypothetical protein